MNRHPDFPFDEVVIAAHALAQKGVLVFQKFTCASCGARLTMQTPNHFYRTGKCDCGAVTNIESRGCNYMLQFRKDGP